MAMPIVTAAPTTLGAPVPPVQVAPVVAPATAPAVATPAAAPAKISVQQFSQRVKQLYPEYTNVDDATLAQKVVAKYPEYANTVDFPAAPVPQPGMLSQIGTGIENFARGIIKPVAETAIQMPRMFGAGVARLAGNEQLAGDLTKPVQVPFLGEVKGLSADPADVQKYGAQTPEADIGQALQMGANLIGGEGAAGAVENGLGGAIREGVVGGAIHGAGAGALYGAGGAMENNASGGEALKGALEGGATGAALGGVLGGAIPVAGKVIGAAGDAVGAVSDAAKNAVDFVKNKLQGGDALAPEEEKALLQSNPQDARVATKMIDPVSGNVVPEPAAQQAVKMGIERGDVAYMKTGDATDKAAGLEMANTRESNLNDRGIKARAIDTAGNSAIETRLKPLEDLKNQAKGELQLQAQKLAGQKMNPQPALAEFIQKLEDNGVKIGDKLDYKGSIFEASPSQRKLLDLAWERMSKLSKTGDALQAHTIKKLIDASVDFGVDGTGVSGATETILKNLRHNLDGELDSTFPAYNAANTKYYDTIGALEKIAKLTGKSFKIDAKFAAGDMGADLRGLLSNNGTRIKGLEAFDGNGGADAVLRKYGIQPQGDLYRQAQMASILEKLLGTEADTGFTGQIQNAIKHATTLGSIAGDVVKNPIGALSRGVQYGLDLTSGVTNKAKLAAFRGLLEDGTLPKTTFGVPKG